MDTLQQVKHWAECGWTQADCAQALGLTEYQFRLWREDNREFKWPRNRSIEQRACNRDRNTPACAEGRARARQARLDRLPQYTVRGVTGTRVELCRRFAVVSYESVYRRMLKGWEIERALLTPSTKRRAPRRG